MHKRGLRRRDAVVKRAFDLVVAAIVLTGSCPLLFPALLVAAVETRESGLFKQNRVGRNGALFELFKIRTMRDFPTDRSTVTTRGDARITRSGVILRRLKIDELPQMVNVLRGEMSVVGPRPDVPGFADALEGDERRILAVRPGITGPASIAYRNEEALLSTVSNPEEFNREVIWPDKVRLNLKYVDGYTFVSDLRYVGQTLRSIFARGGAS